MCLGGYRTGAQCYTSCHQCAAAESVEQVPRAPLPCLHRQPGTPNEKQSQLGRGLVRSTPRCGPSPRAVPVAPPAARGVNVQRRMPPRQETKRLQSASVLVPGTRVDGRAD